MWESRILFDHQDFIVINKPPGISMQSAEDQPGVLAKLQAALQIPKLFLCHRLDKITSGAVILAKNTKANQNLSMAFQNRTIDKFYVAIGDGKPKKKQGVIKGDMCRSRDAQWRLTRKMDNPAITYFKTYSLLPGVRLFLLKPLSGKTHQIRVAMKSLSAPVLGDPLYAKTAHWDRAYLHAYALYFNYLQKQYVIKAPPLEGELFLRAEVYDFIQSMHQPNLEFSRN